jgi:hypothetical protein
MAITGEVPAKATFGCREYQIPGTRAFTPCTGPLHPVQGPNQTPGYYVGPQ